MPGREEALERARQRRATDVKGLAQEFVEPYGLDAQPPLERSPFAFHDGGHLHGKIPPTTYGELLQNVHDHAAFDKLYGSGAIHSNPSSYGELDKGGIEGPRSSSFVNYGFMPNKSDFNQDTEKYIKMGADPEWFKPGGESSWDTQLSDRIKGQQGELSRVMEVAEKAFKRGDFTFFQGAGGYQPEQGFMPTPDLRNTRKVAPQDVNTARVRGENFADNLLKGYKEAVKEGRYAPSRVVVDGMIDAADLSDAGMDGEIDVGRGWADEDFFPYKDRMGALSNPPARINPRITEISDESQRLRALGHVSDLAVSARNARALNRVSGAIRTGFGAVAETTGSVPFLDPGFRAAVESGRPEDAAKVLATDLVAGAVAAPVVGAAAGVLERAAPRVAARALPAVAAASRVGNPVAVVSQLGGDRQLTKAQEVADRQAGEAQQNRARLARQRGGRISFPTPFGKVRLPDFGASESGGLFLGGNSSGRRIGARSVLGGKPVVWTGDSYGWQSPGTAAKVGVR